MNPQAFEALLKTEHFREITDVDRPAGYQLGEHMHPFDACALVTDGQITLVVAGVSTTYAAGDVFRLAAGTPHLECAGPHGVIYRVGRRAAAAS
ncbi:cupin domain-containing protein [Polaromonas sp.]|uniref:cupin domain-containing protein n=1 Tax=Polaromonas sp. TaxID=1869339 RepID=UPI0024890EE3|nr:cupin domain-containing protein [Polaromonas sp.]MDI1341712.1 cupin domain-containing protein [Polaromonas sp.]